jgi:hypothetical protein
MSRFVAVFHKWHVTSRGFSVEDLKASNGAQALDEAAGILRRRNDGFYAEDFCLVELDDTEHLPRRLTWRERFTGKLA